MDDLLALVEQAENAEALAALDKEAAAELLASLDAGYQDVKGSVTSKEGVAQLTQVVAAMTAVAGRIEAIDTEAAEVQAELERLDAEAAAAASGDEPAGDDDAAGGDDAAGDDDAAGGDDAPAGDAPADDDAAADRVAAGAGPAKARANRPAFDKLRKGGSNAPLRTEVEGDPNAAYRMTASANMAGVSAGTEISRDQFGKELREQHRDLQTLRPQDIHPEARTRDDLIAMGIPLVGGRKHYISTLHINTDRDGVVELGAVEGAEGGIDRAVREWAKGRDEALAEMARVTAAGGDCDIPAMPDYSIDLVGDPGTCFTDDIPTVVSQRPMSYYRKMKIDQSWGATGRGSGVLAAEGQGRVTVAQDAAGYGNPDAEAGDPDEIPVGGAPYKHTVHIDCPPDMLRCDIEAFYQGVTLGHFQAMSHPEYVTAFQSYMDIWMDIARDNIALGKFVAEATAQNHLLTANEKTFGAVSTLKDVLSRLVAQERSARHAPNLSFNVAAPDWFGGFLALDIMRHTFGSLENLRATPQQALGLANTDGIRFSTYCTEAVQATGGSNVNTVLTPITSGAVKAWPTKVRLLIWADGAIFKRTQGEVRVGLRETLYQTNDYGMFLEIFENVCFRDDVYVLDVTLCPNGASGAPVALVCA